MVERGYTSTLEEWGHNGSWRNGEYEGFMRTHSHAWSAYPAEFLVRTLTGFEVRDPGCAAVAVDPRDVEFDYAVTIPTPRGPVEVERANGAVDVSVPEGVALLE